MFITPAEVTATAAESSGLRAVLRLLGTSQNTWGIPISYCPQAGPTQRSQVWALGAACSPALLLHWASCPLESSPACCSPGSNFLARQQHGRCFGKGNLSYLPGFHCCFHKYCLVCLPQFDSTGIFMEFPITDDCGSSLLNAVEDTVSAFNEDSCILKGQYHNLS